MSHLLAVDIFGGSRLFRMWIVLGALMSKSPQAKLGRGTPKARFSPGQPPKPGLSGHPAELVRNS